MYRIVAASLAIALALVVSASAQAKKYGKPLTLKTVTKISDIYAQPDKYKDKRVQVQGKIVDVCDDMGCWIALASDKEGQTIRFKVDDGVIVFPMTAKGLTATVEGIIAVDVPADHDNEKEGKMAVMIKGEGAEIK